MVSPAHAAASTPDPKLPPALAPMNALYQTVACDPAGPTANDAALATQLNSQLNSDMRGSMTAYRVSCAREVVEAVHARGLASRAGVIAIATVIVETHLQNISEEVDHTSLGLFQQQEWWGTRAERLDPATATNKFLSAMQREYPNGSWATAPIGEVCQAVQVSAYPDKYQVQASDAQIIVNALWNSVGSSSGVSGDFNGDNKDDVMARSATTGELWLYPGTGSFTTDAILGQPIRVGTGWSQFDLIFSGDFNRDGKSDIVGRRPSDGTLWVYPGTGSFVTDQVLSAPTRIGVGWNQFSAIFTGDFNQDGKSDVVARGAADNVLLVYPGTGTLTTDAVVLPPTRVGVGWGDLGLFSSGDFNQDGKSDIVARRISDGVLLLWPGTGTLTTDRVVNPGIQVGIGWGGMNALTAGDFNQDGKSDVVVRSTTDATLWMYPGTGSLTPNQILTSPKRVGIGWGGMDRIS
ncbi:hypothetical protein GCM10009687_38460 [Asanoa iriomotensis]